MRRIGQIIEGRYQHLRESPKEKKDTVVKILREVLPENTPIFSVVIKGQTIIVKGNPTVRSELLLKQKLALKKLSESTNLNIASIR